MKTKKIRGHKRIWKAIENWKNSNLKLDLAYLRKQERDYAKIWINPYSRLLLTNSENPQPKSETKTRILNGLFDIYESWKSQLDDLNEPYYLKIWLFEPMLSKSQVVCAIGNSINYYENTFNYPENVKEFNPNSYGILKSRMEKYNWQHTVDVEVLDNATVGIPEDYATEKDYLEFKKWFESRLKKPYRKRIFEKPIGDITETYTFNVGKVWIGEK